MEILNKVKSTYRSRLNILRHFGFDDGKKLSLNLITHAPFKLCQRRHSLVPDHG